MSANINNLNERLLVILGLSPASAAIVMERITELEKENAQLRQSAPSAETKEGHQPYCDRLLAGKQVCNCGYDTTIAGLTSQLAALRAAHPEQRRGSK